MRLVAQSCPTLCDPMDCSPPGSSVHGDSPGENTRVCHALLQEIFPTQGSNPRLLHCRQILYYLSRQGRTMVARGPFVCQKGLDPAFFTYWWWGWGCTGLGTPVPPIPPSGARVQGDPEGERIPQPPRQHTAKPQPPDPRPLTSASCPILSSRLKIK